jgi:hypothetical protein
MRFVHPRFAERRQYFGAQPIRYKIRVTAVKRPQVGKFAIVEYDDYQAIEMRIFSAGMESRSKFAWQVARH